MPTIEVVDREFDGQSFNIIPSNSRSFVYCFSCKTDLSSIYAYRTDKIFRISIFGKSVCKIGEIEVPRYSDPMFNIDQEEICWLSRVSHSPPVVEPTDGCLLTLVTYGVTNGAVNRFYHVTNINCSWSFMRKIDGEVLAYPRETSDDALHIFAISYMDTANNTFELSPYLSLPFFNTLRSIYECTDYFANFNDQITVMPCHLPGQILYFKFGKSWFLENYCTDTNGDNFQVQKAYCNGFLILETGQNENENPSFRILIADQNNVWKLTFKGLVPPGFRGNGTHSGCSFSGQLFAVFKYQNSSQLSISVQSCIPFTLLETCISVLWPWCKRMNPQLDDYEICNHLALSKYVNVDELLGKKFLC